MKNNALVLVLSTVVFFLSIQCLLFFVGKTVSLSLGPLTAEVGGLKVAEQGIQRELNSGTNDLKNQLEIINKRLTVIESKGSNNGNMVPNNRAQAAGGCGGVVGEDVNKVYTIPVGDSSILGKKNAPITITAFIDIQCPFCTRFYPPVEEVVKAYPDKVKVMIKNYPLPFHQNALGAAKLSLAAKTQGKYFEMVNLLLQNKAETTDERIKEYAKTLGINEKKLMEDFKNMDAQWQKLIDADKALAEQVGVRGTPTFFINGKLTQARDLAAYKVEVDKILSVKK